MKLFFVVTVLICFSLSACKKHQELPPVPMDKMGEVLLDIQLAETYSLGLGSDSTLSRFSKNYDSLELFYSTILKHHNLTFTKFNEALKWYQKRPQQADSLFSLVLDNLHVLQSEFQIPDEEEKTERDKVKLKTDRPNPESKAGLPSLPDRDPLFNKRHRDSVLKTQLAKPPVLEASSNE